MQMCPDCDRVYDESEYTHCPYCSGELDAFDDDEDEVNVKYCPNCGGNMYWDGYWECSDCGCVVDTDEDDYDTTLIRHA